MARTNRHPHRETEHITVHPARSGGSAFTIIRREARAWVNEGAAFWMRGCDGIRLVKDSYPVFHGRHLDELLARRHGKLRMPEQSNAIYGPGTPARVNGAWLGAERLA